MGVVVGIVQVGVAVLVAADVVEVGGEIGGVDAHVDFLCGLVGCCEKIDAVMFGLGDRGLDGQPGVEDAEAAVRKRSEEHTSELQSLMRILYSVFCFSKTTT